MSIVVIAGGTGLLGKYLSQKLKASGHEVRHLSRKENKKAEFPAFAWDPEAGTLDESASKNADYVVNLAGAGLADKRWSKARKKVIVESRVGSTLLLKSAIEKANPKPKAYIAASAIGFYGNRGEERLSENDRPGSAGFIPHCVTEWEKAIEKVAQMGIRTVVLRIGMVLSTRGGALPEMLLPFKFFLGGYFGNGRQWFSWIHIEDMTRILLKAMEDDKMAGTFNAVAPNPARCKDLILNIKKALGKPAFIIPAPAFGMRLIMGEMVDMVLDSTFVSAEKIVNAGFDFHFPDLLPALKDLVSK